MNPFEPRGACPGLSTPMPTGDGLLVRFMPLDGLTLAELRAICAAAQRHGNGTIEITARGSLQFRGLSARSAPGFARAVAELGIAASDGTSIATNPLPDDPESIVDPRPIAAAIRQTVGDASLAHSAKVSVIIDGGGRLHLDALPADIRLRAIGSKERPLLAIAMGRDGGPTTALGAIYPAAADKVVISLLHAIAAQGPHARAADVIRAIGVQRLRSLIADHLQPALAVPERAAAEVIGSHCLRDGSMALGIAPAFGHVRSDTLAALAEAAGMHGVRTARLAPPRALLLLGAASENTVALINAAVRLGFIVDVDDPRRRIVACPGKPACASGLIAARALAAELAQALRAIPPPARGRSAPPDFVGGSRVGVTLQRPSAQPCSEGQAPTRQHLLEANAVDLPLAGGGTPAPLIHISGCAKGCAHPRAAALTVVGTEQGCGIVHHGSARAVPGYHVGPDHLVAEIERIVAQSKEAADA
jgi:precorrin-3B synthase